MRSRDIGSRNRCLGSDPAVAQINQPPGGSSSGKTPSSRSPPPLSPAKGRQGEQGAWNPPLSQSSHVASTLEADPLLGRPFPGPSSLSQPSAQFPAAPPLGGGVHCQPACIARGPGSRICSAWSNRPGGSEVDLNRGDGVVCPPPANSLWHRHSKVSIPSLPRASRHALLGQGRPPLMDHSEYRRGTQGQKWSFLPPQPVPVCFRGGIFENFATNTVKFHSGQCCYSGSRSETDPFRTL